MDVEQKLEELGLKLPAPTKTPPGLVLPSSWVRGDRAYVSGHVPLGPDGSIAEPFGKVGAEVSEEAAYEAARGLVPPPVDSRFRGNGGWENPTCGCGRIARS